MGGAQPLAATLAGACSLNIECQQSAHRLPPAHALPRRAGDRPRRRARAHRRSTPRRARRVSIGLLGNAAEILPELVRRGVRPDARHRPDLGARPRATATCRPAGRVEQWQAAQADPAQHARAARRRGAVAARCTCRRCSTSSAMGIPTVDYGNNIRQVALDEGVHERLRLPRLRAGLHPPAVLPRHRARSAGSRCPAIRRTSARPTRR